MTQSTLRLVLGDQLSRNLSALDDLDVNHDTVVMMEVADEGRYVPHHPKKIVFLLSAMRHFAAELEADGVRVTYVRLDSKQSKGSLTDTLKAVIDTGKFDSLVVTEPGEYRVLEMMRGWSEAFGLPVEMRDDTRFFCSKEAFAEWADGRKQLTMEYFYREWRKKTGLLMAGGKPAGNQWNFDKENRKPPKSGMTYRALPDFKRDAITNDVIKLVGAHFDDHFGDIEPFNWAVTSADAERALDHFIEHGLPSFGDYQDAMVTGEPFMFHSVISHYLNAGLLDARAICDRAEAAWRDEKAPINAAEGFVRQILGWREFIRGVYWLKMPDYAQLNALEAGRPLPPSYWGGETKMNCIKEVVRQTRENAYSHHIQRLMVTGNFALLTGIAPQAIHEWYLAVYADAYEWVEMPNTLGMAIFADGGIVGTKPYAASGAYINKMSNFCADCAYNVRKKEGEDACPFNYLYWYFMHEQRERLGGNRRLAFPYRTLAKFDQAKIDQIVADSERFLAQEFADS